MLDETGINALLAATQNKHIEVAKYLLVNGARTDIYSKQFLELVISFSNENFLYDIIQEDILVATFIIAYVMNLAPNLAKNLVEPYSDVFKSLGQRGYKVLLQVGDQALKKGKCVEAEYCYKQVQKIFPDKLFPELCIKHLKSFLPDQEAENRQEQENCKLLAIMMSFMINRVEFRARNFSHPDQKLCVNISSGPGIQLCKFIDKPLKGSSGRQCHSVNRKNVVICHFKLKTRVK